MSALRRLMPAAVAAALPVGATAETYGKYEAPPYTVEARLSEAEIRAYAPHILAEVRVQGDRRAALNAGFRVLAGYIFGGNTDGQDVAMTVPVAQSQTIDMTAPVTQTGADGVWTVSFMMPRQWTLDTLPVPNSDAITFRKTEAHREAVLTFSGRASEAQLAAREAELRATLAAEGIETEGPVRHYYYDDPFTLPWARRNEVALRLR